MTLQPYQLINTPAAWARCLDALQQESRLAVDLESNSMYAYREQVCLIQISIPEHDYIIDPLADFDLDGLGVIIEDPGVEKVFHAAEYDLILMKKDYGWELQNLFDTMWAVRVLGYQRVGLANVLEKEYGIKLDKRFQRSNWCKRPQSDEALRYAQRDTAYLLQLRDDLEQKLRKMGRYEEAQESFAEQCKIEVPDTSFSEDDFWSINGARKLSERGRAILKALTIFRDREARRRDRPVFKIFHDKTLLQLARQQPRYQNELHQIHGLSRRLVRRYGNRLLSIISDAMDDPAPRRRQRGPRTPDDVIARYEQLHTWRKLRARDRNVESDVVISRDALWQLAHHNPQTMEALTATGILPPWRLQKYGPEIVKLLRKG